jgi:hypothetical protein
VCNRTCPIVTSLNRLLSFDEMRTFLAAALSLAAVSASRPGFLTFDAFEGTPYAVSYDNRSLLLNGERTIFHSFGVHYTRATAQQWDDVLFKAANDGYNSKGPVHC